MEWMEIKVACSPTKDLQTTAQLCAFLHFTKILSKMQEIDFWLKHQAVAKRNQ